MPVAVVPVGHEPPSCVLKQLPEDLLVEAAERACEINPDNAPKVLPRAILSPERLALLTSKYWGKKGVKLSVSFMGGSAGVRSKILAHANAWGEKANVVFAETAGQGQVRIAFENSGYWSYLGSDILSIPANEATMNLQGFSTSTPESEFFRVVRHEVGHTLGAPHEHAQRAIVNRIDEAKAIDYFRRTQGWDERTTRQQVLTPLEESSIFATPADVTSIMAYQLPSSIMKDGVPVPGGSDINPTDAAFMAKMYPKAVEPPPPPPPGGGFPDYAGPVTLNLFGFTVTGQVRLKPVPASGLGPLWLRILAGADSAAVAIEQHLEAMPDSPLRAGLLELWAAIMKLRADIKAGAPWSVLFADVMVILRLLGFSV